MGDGTAKPVGLTLAEQGEGFLGRHFYDDLH
jgi:hypothetical protein